MLTITVDLIFIYSFCIEGARAGWILVADHPPACNHPVPAVLWSFYHSASGEGGPHRSCLVHTHTGMSLKNTALFLPSLINIVIELMQRLFRRNLIFRGIFSGLLWFRGSPRNGQTHTKPVPPPTVWVLTSLLQIGSGISPRGFILILYIKTS